MKKLKVVTAFVVMLAFVVNLVSINAIDYAANENYYKSVCNDPVLSKQNSQACRGFADYLNEKIQDSQSQANKYKEEIDKYKGDLAKQVELAKEYENEIADSNYQISVLNNNIAKLEASIKKIEQEIIEREQEIAEKEEIIIERMRKTQSDIRFGFEIDFLIKARDFASLLSSTFIVNDILDYEAKQIEEINVLIRKQKEDQDAILLQKETVENNLAEVQIYKNKVLALKVEVEKVIANYQSSMNELLALQSQAIADAAAIKKQMSSIYKALETMEQSTGFIRPIGGGYISARVWAYPAPWSAPHYGYDYASSVGTPIRAAANGVILSSSNNCPTYGGLGNWCGAPGLAGGGNQVTMLVRVNNSLYGIGYYHMESGSPIKSGQAVRAGQTIGRLGSSGNSTGPHTHVEVFYLGNYEINNYINNIWNGSLTFNTRYSSGYRCDVNGNSAPCIVNPGSIFGNN